MFKNVKTRLVMIFVLKNNLIKLIYNELDNMFNNRF